MPGLLKRVSTWLFHRLRLLTGGASLTYKAFAEDPRYADPRCLVRHGGKTYSQNDEDGVIHEIFRRIGVTNKTFVEFGVGTGLENNTVALLLEDWRGLWIEGSAKFVRDIRRGFKRTIEAGQLKIVHSFITRENINALISTNLSERDIDLLVIDVDGNDAHLAEAITCISPRVIVIEYNAKFLPHIDYCLAYDAQHQWRGDDCCGASLKHLEQRLGRKGYSLVGCTLAGVNAFFVRNDLLGDHFLPPFTAENHYQPARYFLTGMPSGHEAAYRTIDERMRG